MPKSACLYYYYAFLITCALRVLAATNHMVIVGVEGSFFDPPTISAQVNDTVTFVFGGDIHSVTQSSFENPCQPLQGGFNSGFLGRGPNFAQPILAWNLVITNDSSPIWFFCEVTTPSSHCASGMVGAINPPSIEMFNNFTAAAKLVTATTVPLAISLALTGSGAFATASPAVTSVPMSILSSTPLSATPTSTITSTITSTSSDSTSSGTSTSAAASSTSSAATVALHHTNIGAIVGGIIGGVTLFLVLLIMLLWRRKNRPTSTSFFQYSVPVRQLDPTEAFRAAKSQEERERMYELPYDGSQPSSPRTASGMPSRKPSVSSALLLQSQRAQTPAVMKQASFSSTTVDNSTAANNALGTGTVTDRDAVLQMLAQEVASVLQPAHRPTEPAPKLAPNRARVQAEHGNDLNGGETPAPPPNYRAALGGQSPSW